MATSFTLFTIPPSPPRPIEMPPITRSSPTSANAGLAASKRRKSSEGPYPDPSSRERTKRGCWTCRIRRKKCDEEQMDGCCKTCRRLRLECLGWGSKRPEWMKDKKAVDTKKAEIKAQLAHQGMIRGQARNPALQGQHRNSSANDASYLVPSSHSETTPSPSSRPSRAAKTQANAALSQQTFDDISPASPNSEDDASGSDEDDYGPEDSDMSPNQAEDHLELPRFFDSSNPSGSRPASSATPSFPNSPLHAGAGFADGDATFSAHFTIPGLSDASAFDGMMDTSGLGAFGVHGGLGDIGHGLDDPYGNLDLSGGVGFDLYAATLASTLAHPQKDHPMSISMPLNPSTSVDMGRSASISPPALTAANAARNSTSPSMQPQANLQPHHHQQDPHSPAGSPSILLSSSAAAMSLSSGFGNSAAFASMLPNSYFPAPPLATSPPPALTPAPAAASSTSKAVVPGNRSRHNTDSPPVTRGHFPQPSQSFSPFMTAAQQAPTAPTFGTFTISYKPTIRTPLADPTRSLTSFQETLVFYYFNRGVRRMQYLLADDSTTGVTDVMYDLVIRDPLGPVTNAICSLSSLHDTRLRIAHGLLHPEDPHAHDNAQKLYSDTVLQLQKKANNFTPVEAIAALHLLSFWLFCGGGGDWASALAMAEEWLYRSEVMNESADPIEVIERWTPPQRFAAQSTLWFDILGSCSLQKRPRFMKLYKRMMDRNKRVANAGGILFNQRRPTGATSELMNQVMGCDDEIMFALAAITDLAAWKAKQVENGTLSYRELVDRGRVIEEDLSKTKVVVSPHSGPSSRSPSGLASPVVNQQGPRSSPQPAATSFQQATPSVWDPFGAAVLAPQPPQVLDPTADGRTRATSVNTPPPAITRTSPASTSSSSVTGTPGPLSIITTSEPVTLRQLSSNVFREAAFLFLHSVVSGCEPAVKEIKQSVNSVMEAIIAIPSRDLDRSLVFPITLAGCLAESREHREFFADRLAAQGSAVGNGSQAKLLMETTWRRRDAGEKGINWRDVMKDLGFDLLLV